jgi:hypothetical protein
VISLSDAGEVTSLTAWSAVVTLYKKVQHYSIPLAQT